jgi:ATP-dependent zinc metalloprotease ftsH
MATLLPIMAMVFIGYLIYRSMMRNMGDPFSKDNTIAQRIKTDKKFSDIAGNEEVKEEV